MNLKKKSVNGETYTLFPVLQLRYREGNIQDVISEKIESDGRTPIWRDGYLERIIELDPKAKRAFNTNQVGILYFVNGQEPQTKITDYDFFKGDLVELAYINKEWDKTLSEKM